MVEKIVENKRVQIDFEGLETPHIVAFAGENFVILKESEYAHLQEALRALGREVLYKQLEREILLEMPKDFDDVFVVAKQALEGFEARKKAISKQDIKKIIRDIKANYPNLFVNVDEFFPTNEERE